MPLKPALVEEINILIKFNLHTTQEGIKVHKTASQETIDATKRLFSKGLITQEDGGYLTFGGRETAEHAQALVDMLTLGEAQNVEQELSP